MKTGIFDSEGKEVCIGDLIHFSYGIPGIGVNAPIVIEKGIIYALTPGHNPKKVRLNTLKNHVGDFYITG